MIVAGGSMDMSACDGKPKLEWDLSQPFLYDLNDPDSQFVMFDRRLEGCAVLPFNKPMSEEGGSATVMGRPIPARVCAFTVGGESMWWLAIRLCGVLYEHGQTVHVRISGFRDAEGRVMEPVTLVVQTGPKAEPLTRYAAHERVALEAARDGIVLMKNRRNALPLRPGTMDLFGSGMYEFRICSIGAGKITPRYAIGLLEAARREQACKPNEELCEFFRWTNAVPGEDILRRARARSDTAVMVLSRPSGESTDNSTRRGEARLTGEEEELLAALRGHFDKLVVILNVGYPIDLGFAERYDVDALVYNGFGGMLAGPALMDVLTGRVDPSGRLPDTWPAHYESSPASRNFYNSADGRPRIPTDGEVWLNTVYEEDIYVGYRYFETFPQADHRGYPFGHGLSYTRFERTGERMSFDGQTLYVAATVKNIGDVPGREVLQLYLAKPDGAMEQPARELVAFEKTALLPAGGSCEVALSVPLSRMTSYDASRSAFVALSGEYEVYLGGSVREAVKIGRFYLPADRVVRRVKARMRPNVSFTRFSRRDPDGTYPSGELSGVAENVCVLVPKRGEAESFVHPILPNTGRRLTFADVLRDEGLLPEFVGGMDVKTLSRLSVCAGHGWRVEARGEAGRLFRVRGLGLPEMIAADGNSGVNLHDANIGMPSGVTLAASFDKDLMERVGRVIGEEARALGVHLILAPGMNLHRNGLNGRQPEYFSEDPYLAGTMAGVYCRGLESTGVGGCYKHLIANNAESGRKRNQSIISERAIRELYFRAFAYALEIHEPVSVMTAYNAVNGCFTSCDPELIQGMLFEECGFSGFVMTDWNSYDSADVAEMAAAGNCWITPGSEDDTYAGKIEAAVADGRLDLGQLQENVLRLVRAMVRLERGRRSDAAI